MLRHDLVRWRRGAAAIEYVVLLSAIVGAAGAAFALVGTHARDQFARTSIGLPVPSPPSDGSGGGTGGAQGTSFNPLHDNFNGKGGMPWRDSAGRWTTEKGERTSSDPWAATIADVGGNDYTYKVTLQTTASSGPDIWNTTRAVFRYQDAQNYYAIVTKKDGVVELAKMQGGVWRPWLAYANTGVNPFKANDYQVRVAGGTVEVKVNGKTAIRYTDSKPIATGGVGAINDGSSGRMSKVTVTPNNGN